jgi:hypothetical protein
MPWSDEDPPAVAKNWSAEEKHKCVIAANAALDEGASDEEAIYACIAAAGRKDKVAERTMTPSYIRAYRQVPPADAAEGPLRFVASTAGIKRDGMDIAQDGWDIDNYLRNPVVLWAHDYVIRPPIGRAIEVGIAGMEMTVVIEFDLGDLFASETDRKYRAGFMNAVSVGWNPLQADGTRILRQELLDISAVSVPGDPDALIMRQARALNALLADVGVTQPGSEVAGRIGAVLNARNKSALEQAVELIQQVLRSAAHEEEPPKDDDEERTLTALQQILERLTR